MGNGWKARVNKSVYNFDMMEMRKTLPPCDLLQLTASGNADNDEIYIHFARWRCWFENCRSKKSNIEFQILLSKYSTL